MFTLILSCQTEDVYTKPDIVIEQGHENHLIVSVRPLLMNRLVVWHLNILQFIVGEGATVIRFFILK